MYYVTTILVCCSITVVSPSCEWVSLKELPIWDGRNVARGASAASCSRTLLRFSWPALLDFPSNDGVDPCQDLVWDWRRFHCIVPDTGQRVPGICRAGLAYSWLPLRPRVCLVMGMWWQWLSSEGPMWSPRRGQSAKAGFQSFISDLSVAPKFPAALIFPQSGLDNVCQRESGKYLFYELFCPICVSWRRIQCHWAIVDWRNPRWCLSCIIIVFTGGPPDVCGLISPTNHTQHGSWDLLFMNIWATPVWEPLEPE